jgi:ribosomal-protein-alanine N-acetyltransferase
MNLELRPLDLADLDAIEEIERTSYPAPWSRSMFASELAKPSSLSVGAWLDGTLVAFLVISRYVDAWHIMNLAVAPSHRRLGLATALLDRLFELTESDGHRGYTLEVRVSNVGAIRLYERRGFQARGVRRGYYTDNREDALIMWRDPPSRSAVEEVSAGNRGREVE